MGDRAMMSAYYSKPGQRPEDNVRAIADALAVYLAWSFRNSVARVKKTTTSPVTSPKAGSPAGRTSATDRTSIAQQEPTMPPTALRPITQSDADRRADIAAILGLMPYEML
jgi:hypothetical protein